MVGDHTSDTKGKHNETIGQRQTGQTSVCDPRHAGKPPTCYTAPPPPFKQQPMHNKISAGPGLGGWRGDAGAEALRSAVVVRITIQPTAVTPGLAASV